MSETPQRPNHRKERTGEVLSSKMAKTIVVQVQRRFRHPRYKKVVTSFKKLYAHDETGQARPGDTVVIQETRPISKLKRWRLVQVLNRAAAESALAPAPAGT
jgi:small subunit ribosomal protein S17